MAKIKPFIIILFTATIFAQSNSLSTQSSIPGTKDKLVLVNEVYPDIYDGFKIIRDKETIFTFHKDTILFEAVGRILYKVTSADRKYIILRVYDSPHYGWYLIIEETGSDYKYYGETPECTYEVFGDVDSDGIFEIGLTNPLHEAPLTKEEHNNHLLDNEKVIELRDGFPIDEKLTERYVSKKPIK